MNARFIRLFTTIAISCTLVAANAEDAYQKPLSADDPNYTYEDVGKPVEPGANSLTFDSSDFGMEGPLSVEGTYSSEFGYIVTAMYNQMMGQYNAIGLLADYGDEENRFDITWANQFAAHQRMKFSFERLEQDLDFTYDSGDTSERIAQYSGGAGYQYLFDKGRLNDVEFSGYYAKADSEDLSTVRFVDSSDGNTYDNYRHIAGATSQGLAATLDVLPWRASMMGLGLNYDDVNYDNKYDDIDADNRSGFGFTWSLEQLVTGHLKLELAASQRETNDDYSAKMSTLARVTPTSDIELGLNGERIIGQDSASNDTRLSVEVSYYLDDSYRNHTYSVDSSTNNSLNTWAAQSLAYMDQVLAAADQKTVLVGNALSDEANAVLQSSEDNAVTLQAGIVNSINVEPYIERLNVDTDNKTVEVIGGPDNVTFTYHQAQGLLVSDQVVPSEDIGKEYPPLIMLFVDNKDMATSSKSELARDAGKVVMRVNVAAASNIPFPNPNFSGDFDVTVGSSFTTGTLYLSQWVDGATDATTLFENPSTTDQDMILTNVVGLPAYGLSCTGCESNQANTTQTITISADKVSSSFPADDGLEVSMIGCNTSICSSSAQTIEFTEESTATAPTVTGTTITSPVATAGSSYGGYKFVDEGDITIGSGDINTSKSSYTIYKSTDTTTPITDSGMDVKFTSSEATLEGTPATSYAGDTFDIVVCVKNTESSDTVCNDVDSDPFVLAIGEESTTTQTLTCPSNSNAENGSSSVTQTDDPNGTTYTFYRKKGGSGPNKLISATLKNKNGERQLTCQYTDGIIDDNYVVATPTDSSEGGLILPSDAETGEGNWSGNSCDASTNNKVSDCVITFNE